MIFNKTKGTNKSPSDLTENSVVAPIHTFFGDPETQKPEPIKDSLVISLRELIEGKTNGDNVHEGGVTIETLSRKEAEEFESQPGEKIDISRLKGLTQK